MNLLKAMINKILYIISLFFISFLVEITDIIIVTVNVKATKSKEYSTEYDKSAVTSFLYQQKQELLKVHNLNT
jgi:flagellar basal body L-ring protein FlgH